MMLYVLLLLLGIDPTGTYYLNRLLCNRKLQVLLSVNYNLL